MIVFLLVLLIFTGFLTLYKPLPRSLRLTAISYAANINQIKATLGTGLLVITIFFLTTNFTFSDLDVSIQKTLSISNVEQNILLIPIQVVSNSFLHLNLLHLLGNVVFLAILSVYERRVGSGRFIMVLLVGCFVSTFSIFFYSEPIYIVGISGGLFALAAAYITDHKNLDFREWIFAIVFFVVLAVLLEIKSTLGSKDSIALNMKVDHFGHFLGALGGIVYCRLRPRSIPEPQRMEVPSIGKRVKTINAPLTVNSQKTDMGESRSLKNADLVYIIKKQDEHGQSNPYLHIDPVLLTPFFQAFASNNEATLKEAVFNLFFRIEDRLNTKTDKCMNYDEVIQLFEQSQLEEHVDLFRKYLVS